MLSSSDTENTSLTRKKAKVKGDRGTDDNQLTTVNPIVTSIDFQRISGTFNIYFL